MFIKMFCVHMLAELATHHRVLISKCGEKLIFYWVECSFFDITSGLTIMCSIEQMLMKESGKLCHSNK